MTSSLWANASGGSRRRMDGMSRWIRISALTNSKRWTLTRPARIQCPSLPPSLHTAFRSIVGQVNWLQSRTQFQVCYRFSRSASCCASPTIADLKVANKLIRSLKAEPVTLKCWPLSGDHLRICAYPDAAYRNNTDGSSQRGHAIFLAEPRGLPTPEALWWSSSRTRSQERPCRLPCLNCTP